MSTTAPHPGDHPGPAADGTAAVDTADGDVVVEGTAIGDTAIGDTVVEGTAVGRAAAPVRALHLVRAPAPVCRCLTGVLPVAGHHHRCPLFHPS